VASILRYLATSDHSQRLPVLGEMTTCASPQELHIFSGSVHKTSRLKASQTKHDLKVGSSRQRCEPVQGDEAHEDIRVVYRRGHVRRRPRVYGG
jgi:hypothetical protein